ncbi:MAG: hypothetical protein ABSF52_24170 [Syntrophobacteraceae bacterium]|jgi:hypothetical protein
MKHLREAAVSLALVAAIVIIWCIIYGRTSLAAWNTPVAYGGDATHGGDTTFMLAYAQAFLNPTSAVVKVKLLIFHNLRSKVVTTNCVFQIFAASSV